MYVPLVAQKRRVLGREKSLTVMKEVEEWVKAGIVRPEIRAKPKKMKMKAVTDIQSPKTLKEMQSLSEKLAALNRFLARSAKRSLPFFEMLKDIMKENKDDYRWTEDA
ncbi:hypothetical protein Tco_0014029 [Tanacetum coccineum]